MENILSLEFTKELKITAENIVESVGPESDVSTAATGEEYREVVFRFENENEIIEKWVEYIKSYLVVVQNTFSGHVKDLENKLTIYWRHEPEIKIDEKRDSSGDNDRE